MHSSHLRTRESCSTFEDLLYILFNVNIKHLIHIFVAEQHFIRELCCSVTGDIYALIRQLTEYCGLGKVAEMGKERKYILSFIRHFLITMTLASNLML